MVKKVFQLLAVCFIFFSCHREELIIEPADRTVLIYFVANNTLDRYVEEDIEQIKEGIQNNEIRGKVIVYVNRVQRTYLAVLDKDRNGTVTENIIHEYDRNQNSVSPETMSAVFQETFSRYPADSYSLFLWSHGDGWLPKDAPATKWFGQDGSNFMDISELKTALDRAPHFNFIFFDDCFMQSVEVAYELRHNADYIFGCPTETPGSGAPYQVLMGPVFEAESNIEKMVSNYYDYYAGSDSEKYDDWPYGAAISVIKCSELENLAIETRRLVTDHITDIALVDRASVQIYDTRSRKAYYDLQDFIAQFTTVSERASWEAQLNKTVPYKGSTSSCYSQYIHTSFPIKKYSGVSVYIPDSRQSAWNSFYQTYEWYTAGGWNQILSE